MIFKQALRRELASLAGVVFATLFTIMVTTSLIRMLGRASGGQVDTASVLPLIVFAAINLLPVLLVLTLYIVILMAFTRAYRDSEMVIWASSGRSLYDWIVPVMGFAAPFVVLVAVIGFWAAPWANLKSSEYQSRFAQREDVSRVARGQFRESGSGDRVFFIEGLDRTNTEVRSVFVTQTTGQQRSVVVSRGGRIETEENGDRFLVLEGGRRYDGDITGSALRLMEFERYGLRLDPKPPARADVSSKVRPTADLVANPTPRNLGELLWRLSLPISALLLALLAIPLSSMNPRVGRSINLGLALLIYVIYNNLSSVAQAWVAQGRVSFWLAVWPVHLLLVLVVGTFFYARVAPRGMRLRLRRQRQGAN